MTSRPVLEDFEIEEPTIAVDQTTGSGGGWKATGTVTFAVKAWPKGANRVSIQAYGAQGAGFRPGDLQAAKIELGFYQAASEKDALSQAAAQLETVVALLKKKADDLK